MKKLILFTLLFISCNSKDKKGDIIVLSGTKWECKIADDCISIYEFKSDNSYLRHSCEMRKTYFGNYYFKRDTLFLDEKGSTYDKFLPKNSHERTRRRLYQAIIRDDKLNHLYVSDWVNEKWKRSDFKFDDAYFYKRVVVKQNSSKTAN